MANSDFGDFESFHGEEPVGPSHLAPWRQRALAWLIDAIIALAVFLIPTSFLLIGAFAVGDDEAGINAIEILFVGGHLVAIIWAGWIFGYRQGRTGTTPGKRQQGLMLVDVDTGLSPGGALGVGRWLVPGLISLVVWMYPAIDYLWPVWDRRNQRVTDKIFRTVVVKG